MKTKNSSIEGLRGISMLLVIIHHLFYGYTKHYAPMDRIELLGIEHYGYVGVSLFLLISGYYIISPRNTNRVLYFVKRIIRLWPVYFVAITSFFVLTQINPLPDRTPSIMMYLMNIPFINGFIGVGYVDGSHWYLTTLIGCMFISMFLYKLKGETRLIFLLTWLVLVLLGKSIFTDNWLLNIIIHGVCHIIGGEYSPIFISGISLRVIKEEKKSLYLIVLMFALIDIFIMMGWKRTLLFFAAICFFTIIKEDKITFFRCRLLTWLGKISYSTYVMHQNIGFWFIYMFSAFVGEYNPLISLGCFFMVIGIGAVVYYFIEIPCKNIANYIDNLKANCEN